MRTSNPALNDDVFRDAANDSSRTMTLQGTVLKTGVLLCFLVGTAGFAWMETHAMAPALAPKYMEWYAGFGLLVTLVWLYLEILRLLSKLRDRR